MRWFLKGDEITVTTSLFFFLRISDNILFNDNYWQHFNYHGAYYHNLTINTKARQCIP